MTFILASNNKKKLVEMQDILSGFGTQVISQGDAGLNLDVEETGTTFAENALLKALAACRASNLPSISDDSGLEVEALNGAPGVWSARYGGEGLNDQERLDLLLKNLEDVEHRDARFVSSIACVFPNGDTIKAEGYCYGKILSAPRGDGGFGYDPIFYIENLGKTMAELEQKEKNSISHRGNALRDFKSNLETYLKYLN